MRNGTYMYHRCENESIQIVTSYWHFAIKILLMIVDINAYLNSSGINVEATITNWQNRCVVPKATDWTCDMDVYHTLLLFLRDLWKSLGSRTFRFQPEQYETVSTRNTAISLHTPVSSTVLYEKFEFGGGEAFTRSLSIISSISWRGYCLQRIGCSVWFWQKIFTLDLVPVSAMHQYLYGDYTRMLTIH